IPATDNNNFDYCQKILVHPETGHIYVATVDGLWRSTTNGDSFFEVLGNTWGQNDLIYDIQLSPNGMLYVSNSNHLFRSSTGNGGEWENMTAGFISGYSRIEFTSCASNPDRMYVIGVKNGEGQELYVSDNAGDSWVQRTRPGDYDFTQGQGLYDLVVGTDPEACDNVIVGGAAVFQSIDAGQEWFGYYWGDLHPDHHVIHFDPERPGRVLFGNDGGVYQSTLSSINNETSDHNQGYITTQFYACAFHPDFISDYMLGGTQDNFSLQLNGLGVSPARTVRGGDGMYCHIDQSDPQLQMVCSQFANYSLTRDGGTTWNDAAGFNGRFVSASDYDNVNHLMYSQTNDVDADYYRWDVGAGDFGTKINVDEFDGNSINALTCDPNDPTTLYFGLSDGSVYRVLDGNTGTTADAELLQDFVGSVSCVEVQIGNPDHIIVTLGSYGLSNSIYQSLDGGQSWTSIEGSTLPDIPVRWALINPENPNEAMIATELGVWTTDFMDGSNTIWYPPVPGKGTPLTRTTMLQYRESDKQVLVATYGRGLWTSDVFSDAYARVEVDRVKYLDKEVEFLGEYSLSADSYEWNLWDGSTETTPNVQATFSEIGTYAASLTINGSASAETDVKVLPDLETPFTAARSDYGGGFESNDEQFGVYNVNGSGFVKGKSSVEGKEGTNSGDFAYVIAPEDEGLEDFSHAMLYTPNYDFSETGFYEFSFWANFKLQNTMDGFRVEYSTDRGDNWKVLGFDEEDWYNAYNQTFEGAAFPIGSRYFSRNSLGWQNFTFNASTLSGEESVAFRFVFRSDNTGTATVSSGLAIDDVEVRKSGQDLATILTTFEGEFISSTEAEIRWTTQPEFNCQGFILERSEDGNNWEVIDDQNSTGFIAEAPQQYSAISQGQKKLYFFRLFVINELPDSSYVNNFYSETIAVRRNLEGTEILNTYPSPFTTEINMTFTDIVEAPVRYELYDVQGRLILNGQTVPGGPFLSVPTPTVAAGIYFLSVQI
ncbi:MAG: PKD domain-containing protein, partial [Bacteroidota bacterium]